MNTLNNYLFLVALFATGAAIISTICWMAEVKKLEGDLDLLFAIPENMRDRLVVEHIEDVVGNKSARQTSKGLTGMSLVFTGLALFEVIPAGFAMLVAIMALSYARIAIRQTEATSN